MNGYKDDLPNYRDVMVTPERPSLPVQFSAAFFYEFCDIIRMDRDRRGLVIPVREMEIRVTEFELVNPYLRRSLHDILIRTMRGQIQEAKDKGCYWLNYDFRFVPDPL